MNSQLERSLTSQYTHMNSHRQAIANGEQSSTCTVVLLYFDGGCVPNPGRGYGSYEVIGRGLNRKVQRTDFGANFTNNMAEYTALLGGLQYLSARTDKSEQLMIYTDSNLISQQLRGIAKVRSANLKDLWAKAIWLLLPYRNWSIEWRGREANVARFGH